MLFDSIKKKYKEILKKKDDASMFFPFKLRGELEVIVRDKYNKIIQYDINDNIVTLWGKHAVMHLLSGEVFSANGTTRLTGSGDHTTTVNNDGTLLSGGQYFDSSTFPGSNGWWSRSGPGLNTQLYSYFPVKMLFGTGYEFNNYNAVRPTTLRTDYTETNFNANINDVTNTYSNSYQSNAIVKTKSINDVNSQAKVTPTLTENEFGISGAIKDGTYNNSATDSMKLEDVSGNKFLTRNYRGIGRPSFIYSKRILRNNNDNADVSLRFDSTVENKIIFTANMPAQTSANAGIFYPYNGFFIKEAGLFCDSFFTLKNTVPANQAASDDSGNTEYDNYRKMPYGIMFAKRYITPVTKSHDVSVTNNWAIFL